MTGHQPHAAEAKQRHCETCGALRSGQLLLWRRFRRDGTFSGSQILNLFHFHFKKAFPSDKKRTKCLTTKVMIKVHSLLWFSEQYYVKPLRPLWRPLTDCPVINFIPVSCTSSAIFSSCDSKTYKTQVFCSWGKSESKSFNLSPTSEPLWTN